MDIVTEVTDADLYTGDTDRKGGFGSTGLS
jgi:dUTPase